MSKLYESIDPKDGYEDTPDTADDPPVDDVQQFFYECAGLRDVVELNEAYWAFGAQTTIKEE